MQDLRWAGSRAAGSGAGGINPPHAAPRDNRLKHRDFWLKEGVVVNLPRLLDQHLVRIAECGQCCVDEGY